MKRLLCAAVLALAASLAHATSYSTDTSDLWYVESEPGWGLNLNQQEDNIFATLFVYFLDNKPLWFVAPNMKPVSPGSLAFVGDLYTTTGTGFGAKWNPSDFSNRRVGPVTFTLNSINSATFTYTVDGISVTKQVVRQPGAFDNLNGTYAGALSITGTGCGAGIDGFTEHPVLFTITQTDNTNISIVQNVLDGNSCTYNGTYSQVGRMGAITASGNCGTLDAVEVQTTITGLSFRLTEVAQGSCRLQGGAAGVRR